jgi:hypothetical protein
MGVVYAAEDLTLARQVAHFTSDHIDFAQGKLWLRMRVVKFRTASSGGWP